MTNKFENKRVRHKLYFRLGWGWDRTEGVELQARSLSRSGRIRG